MLRPHLSGTVFIQFNVDESQCCAHSGGTVLIQLDVDESQFCANSGGTVLIQFDRMTHVDSRSHDFSNDLYQCSEARLRALNRG